MTGCLNVLMAQKMNFEPDDVNTPLRTEDLAELNTSESELILLTDSIVNYKCPTPETTVPSNKTAYTYNDNGYPVTTTYYDGNTQDQKWVGNTRYESVYNDLNQITESTGVKWDTVSNTWKNYSKTVNSYYSSNNKMKEYYNYDWNSDDNDWVYSDYQYYEYNNNDYRTLQLIKNWNTEKSQLINYKKSEYEYTESGLYTNRAHWNYDTNNEEWIGNAKYIYTYDENENLLSYTRYAWNDVNNDWYVYYLEDSELDNNGNEIKLTSYQYYSSADSLVNDEKYLRTFNDQNLVASDTLFRWDTNSQSWNYKSLFNYTYDADGNQSMEIYISWNESTIMWDTSYKYEYEYNAEGTEIFNQRSNWDKVLHQWVKSSKTIVEISELEQNYYYYSWDDDSDDWIYTKYRDFDFDYYGNYSFYTSNTWNSTDNVWEPQLKRYYYYSTDNAYMQVSKSELKLGVSEASQANISIQANVKWWLEEDVDWLTINTETGLGDSTIIITASENITGSERQAQIIITGDYVDPITISVTQLLTQTAIESVSAETNYKIYPNPVSEYINITGNLNQINSIKFYSSEGKLLYNVPSSEFSTINLTPLKGNRIVFMTITDQSGKVETKRLILKD